MKLSDSAIVSEVDFDADGKHQGFLRLPHSVHRSAYGWLPIPVISIKNGEGTRVLLMAGNHGDEYEGQVALCNLAKDLNEDQVKGQVIILPMSNFPAAKAGLRTSPIDDGNLNRSFPGDPNGSPTQVIAHFIESELLPRCDLLLDIHSGGSSLLYLSSMLAVRLDNPVQQAKKEELLDALGLPYAIFYDPSGSQNYSCSAAERCGAIAITTEVGGGGAITAELLEQLERGLYRYLAEAGCLANPEAGTLMAKPRYMEIAGAEYYCYAGYAGLFEPKVELGDTVEKDQLAALIHDPENPWQQPREVFFQHDGFVICKRVPARVERGDCLFHLTTDI